MAVAHCGAAALAQEPKRAVTSGQIKAGAEPLRDQLLACYDGAPGRHGNGIRPAEIPTGQRERFVTSVTRGKNGPCIGG